MIDVTFLFDAVGRLIPLEVMQFRFMQQAFVGVLLLAPMCAAMGVQVVNFRMSFFSEAIGHSAFAGVAIGLLAAVDVKLSMIALAVGIGLLITAVGKRSSLSIDTVIGVFFATVVAFGLAVTRHYRVGSGQMQMFLYGDILTIGPSEIVWAALLLAALMVFQWIGYNRLLYVGLNPVLATAHRVRTRVYQYVFAGLLSLVAMFSVWTVGVFLVTAMLIVPAAAARNFARSAGGMFWWALLVSVTSSVGGLLISAQPWADTAAGAAIILCAALWFAASTVATALRKS